MRNLYIILLIIVSGLTSASAAAQDNYVLNGSATSLGGDCYLLTPNLNTQNGTVWYTNQLNLGLPFSLEFTMNYGAEDQFGADGIVFVLQTVGTNAIGVSGGGMGFQGFNPSFGIEFDTWQNDESGDPFFDHIAFISNGVVNHNAATNLAGPVQASAISPNIEDGQDHVVKVTWNPQNGLIQVFFDCELRLEQNLNLPGLIFNGQNMVYWGFTAATGGAANAQSVCLQDNIISVGPNVSICLGASAQLNVAGDPNGTYSWSPATGLSDPNIQNPIATPLETTTYTVTYFDLCGNAIAADVTVQVTELEVFAPANDQITCSQPQVSINTFNNINQGVNFEWSTPDGNIVSGGNSSTVVVNQAGTYTVTASVQNTCFATAEVVIIENTVPYEANAGIDQSIDCNTSTATLTGSSDNQEAQLTWSYNGAGVGVGTIISATETGTYTLTVLNPENGCTSSDSAEVINNVVFPIAEAGNDLFLSCTNLTGSPDASASSTGQEMQYSWTTSDGSITSGSGSLSPILGAAGTYFLNVTNDSNGCASSDSLTVIFDESSVVDLSKIVYPNIFSPNADQKNDLFKPFLEDNPSFDITSITTSFEMQIYNRWGVLVFEASQTVRSWDGRLLTGEKAGEGVYYYIVRFESDCGVGGEKEMNGTLHLVR